MGRKRLSLLSKLPPYGKVSTLNLHRFKMYQLRCTMIFKGIWNGTRNSNAATPTEVHDFDSSVTIIAVRAFQNSQ
ncbi:hypothetical protein TNCV_534501 [Trichonephila clavipes]|nr:hypothetical protein TNCV_534501 [Trichonephila clavipes]